MEELVLCCVQDGIEISSSSSKDSPHYIINIILGKN